MAMSLRSDFAKSLERDRKQLPVEEPLDGCITCSDVLSGYYLLAEYFSQDTEEQMLVGLRDPNLLASAVGRQSTAFGGVRKWRDPYEIAATLFFGLVKNHAFHDGNKRIALLMLLHQLRRNKRWIDCKQKEFEDLTVAVAGSLLSQTYTKEFERFLPRLDSEVLFIADFVRRKTRRIEDEVRSITFRELSTVLNKHGFDLRDATAGNKIGIYKRVQHRRFFGLLEPREEWQRIGTTGFPSWKKQVARGDLKEVRALTGLTAENGYDSAVFYGDTEPMYGLIETFEGPHKRLKDR